MKNTLGLLMKVKTESKLDEKNSREKYSCGRYIIVKYNSQTGACTKKIMRFDENRSLSFEGPEKEKEEKE